jgi:hypothetical protein
MSAEVNPDVKTRPLLAAMASLPLLLTSFITMPAAKAAAPVQVILDGRQLALSPAPTMVSDRTLVPVRSLLESMGATLTWSQATQTVEITRGSGYVKLQIDRRLACLNRECSSAATLDVPAQLIGNSTFVPVRFISQALGFNVSWDNARRAVVIDTAKAPDYQFNQVTIPSLSAGQLITGPVKLRAAGQGGSEVQFYLVDPATAVARIIAAGSDVAADYTFTPDPTVGGLKLVVAAVTDASGAVRYSDPLAVRLDSQPSVAVTGLDAGGTIDGPISFSSDVNFVATQVDFDLISPDGSAARIGTVGPGDTQSWYPQVTHNGDKSIRATAYDVAGKAYPSPVVPVKVKTDYRTSFSGLKDGDTLTRPVSLSVSGNYPIESVKYVLDDNLLAWGFNYYWKFGPEANGAHTLRVDVMDKAGTWRTLGPYKFTVNTTPQAWLSGVGPDQVVTEAATLKVAGNVNLASVEYYLTNPAGNTQLLATKKPSEAFSWTPTAAQAGKQTLQAKAVDTAGKAIWSDKVSFRVFLGKVYGPVPLAPKTDFKNMAIKLSLPIYREIGMSAALQTAQALLETGWGQSVPVDKYTGQLSYNLFGIKGTGPAGSIISNTWEEYNGVAYRIDADFRAYHSVSESWRDHGDFLIVRPWYAPFRAVMSSPIEGAWALRRSGYATDSQYPVKLINIMKQNGLFGIDSFDF